MERKKYTSGGMSTKPRSNPKYKTWKTLYRLKAGVWARTKKNLVKLKKKKIVISVNVEECPGQKTLIGMPDNEDSEQMDGPFFQPK